MIINYWNLLLADKTKLWITDKVNFAIEASAIGGMIALPYLVTN